MKTFITRLAIGSLLAVTTAAAQEIAAPKPVGTPAASTEGALPALYRAKTKSSFTRPEKGRNPFWPIGFVPRPKSATTDAQLLRIPVEQYKVTSIIVDNPSIAVINGKDYTRGQFLELSTPTGVAKLLITNIEDGFVTVQYKSIVGKIPISRR